MTSRPGQIALWVLVLLSLVLNAFLLVQWFGLRAAVSSALSTAREGLASLATEPLQLIVTLDQDVPIETTIPIDQEISVPLDLDYPLSTTVSTAIESPLLGRQEIACPVEAVIPVHQTVSTRLQAQFPVSFTYRLTAQIPVVVMLPAEFTTDLSGILAELEQALR